MPRKRSRLFRIIALLVVLAVAAYLLFVRPVKPLKRRGAAHPRPAPQGVAAPAPPPALPPPAVGPKVAVIIDDMGSDMAALREILALDAPVSVAVLPRLAHSKETALIAGKAGRDVLLHLPMQPKGQSMKGLGPGALMSEMESAVIHRTVTEDLQTVPGEAAAERYDAAVRKTVSEDLESVPGAVGVNNHMGSLLTEDKSAMRSLMTVLRERGLFFVDSRTTAGSVAVTAAKEAHVRAASRDVFLDVSDNPMDIEKQFDRLAARAKKNGSAIAIGHPHRNTLDALKREIPVLKEKGITVVGVSALVR